MTPTEALAAALSAIAGAAAVAILLDLTPRDLGSNPRTVAMLLFFLSSAVLFRALYAATVARRAAVETGQNFESEAKRWLLVGVMAFLLAFAAVGAGLLASG